LRLVLDLSRRVRSGHVAFLFLPVALVGVLVLIACGCVCFLSRLRGYCGARSSFPRVKWRRRRIGGSWRAGADSTCPDPSPGRGERFAAVNKDPLAAKRLMFDYGTKGSDNSRMTGRRNSNTTKLQSARAGVVTAARSILSGELGVVAGARQLASLRFDVGAEHDPDFIFFVGVDSETDHLPLGNVRSHWKPDVLSAKDAVLTAYEAKVHERAFEVCRSLIQKYETRDA
jgi:hypothetical protein